MRPFAAVLLIAALNPLQILAATPDETAEARKPLEAY